jgi:phosphopantetheinyl transferase
MIQKNEITLYLCRGGGEIREDSSRLMYMCLQHHFGFLPAIQREAKGKPVFVSPEHGAFSVSHSRDLFVLAVGRCEALGVDVEVPVEGKDHTRLMKKYFSSEEREHCKENTGGFYRIWTAKEACCKLIGEGMGALNRIVLSWDPLCAKMAGYGTMYVYDLSQEIGVPCALATTNEGTWKIKYL